MLNFDRILENLPPDVSLIVRILKCHLPKQRTKVGNTGNLMPGLNVKIFTHYLFPDNYFAALHDFAKIFLKINDKL